MASPFEILALAGLQAYLAAPGTTEPRMDQTPPVAWTLLGLNGSDDYDEDGVSVKSTNTVMTYSGLGKTGPLKAWRTEEGLEIDLTLNDMRPEAYTIALAGGAVTTVAQATNVPGRKQVAMLQGYNVQTFALLLRGTQSPYADSMNVQWWIPVVYQDEDPEPKAVKGVPMGLHMTFKALQDSAGGFGVYSAQNAVAL